MASDPALIIPLPAWVDETVDAFTDPLARDAERMALAVRLSLENVQRGGGPFAALVFSGTELVAAAVNSVLSTGYSLAHAETLALLRFQDETRGRPAEALARPVTLVTTTEPCCQCFGAIVWSGIDHLVCGARTSDAERIGFDEGPKPADWATELERRGIAVTRDVERDAARAVLDEYARRGGTIYGRPGRG
ncbi:MAG: nucleoside deaminase [Pseudomonadota bacterium]|nr:MAG: nucleoside deaminase [Pseudomonadota bacterium]